MSRQSRNPGALDAVENLYVEAILDASPEELRAELLAAGEDPEALIDAVGETFRKAVAACHEVPGQQVESRLTAGFRTSAGTVTEGKAAFGSTPVRAAPDPFASHDKSGLKAVAKAFGCNMNFLGRLKDRLVRIEDLSSGFLAALAEALGTGAEILERFLAGPAQVPLTARFKSDGKPAAVEKQSLAEAMEGSGLTDEQKRRLGSL